MCSSIRRWAPLPVLCVASACLEHTPLDPGPDLVVVHGVLNPREPVQHVLVRQTTDGARYGPPVSGATVLLTAPDGATFVGTEKVNPVDSGQFGAPEPRYDIPTGALTAGAAYRLRVLLPTGEVVEGETDVPAVPFLPTATERRFDRDRDTLRLSWPRVTGARAYEVRVVAQRDTFVMVGEGVYIYSYGRYATYVDTSVALPGTLKSGSTPVFSPGSRYDVVVSAVDANYYDYYRSESEPLTATTLPTSLRGAVGVFGAIVPIIRMTVVVDLELGARPAGDGPLGDR